MGVDVDGPRCSAGHLVASPVEAVGCGGWLSRRAHGGRRPGQVRAGVLGGAYVAGAGVSLEELDARGAAAQLAEAGARSHVGDLLVGDGAQVLPHPETPGVARGAARGEHVVGADHLVAVGDAGALAEEQRAVVVHLLQRLARLCGEDLHVLAGEGVRQGVGLVEGRRRRAPRRGRARPDPPCRWSACPAGSRRRAPSPRGPALGGGDQHRRGVRAVLGLAEQVDRDDERVGLVVGDDQDLGRAGEEVDADLAEQLALGLGHVGVARARR